MIDAGKFLTATISRLTEEARIKLAVRQDIEEVDVNSNYFDCICAEKILQNIVLPYACEYIIDVIKQQDYDF